MNTVIDAPSVVLALAAGCMWAAFYLLLRRKDRTALYFIGAGIGLFLAVVVLK